MRNPFVHMATQSIKYFVLIKVSHSGKISHLLCRAVAVTSQV